MKKLRIDSLKVALAEEIHQALEKRWPEAGLDVEGVYQLLVLPPQKEMGHLAWGAFPLAKVLKMAPPVIAQQVAEVLKERTGTLFSQVQSAGPYVNFFFSGKVLTEKILAPCLSGSIFQQKLFDSAPRTMVEFSQPNTHKELHVGHMRNACIGDALVRLFRYGGYPVISTTFPGDVGTHVAKCLWYLKYHNQEPVPALHKGEWLGKMYSKGHLLLEDREGTPEEVKDREVLSMILKQIESKSGEYYNLWQETRQWSIDLMNEVYHWCGIEFDHWYWESDVDSDSVKTIKQYFADGKLIESEGAIGLDLSEQNLGFCVLLKSDGNGLYSTKDIELARRKFQDHHIEKSVYVVDMRQALHFKQVFASLKRLGFDYADHCFHLQYNFVELPDGAMSSRKGNIVPLTRLVHQMEKHVRENYLNRYSGEWSEEDIEATSTIVAQGAIKYGMVRMDPNKKIVFDMAEWLKLDGESGPYIQYAYARVQSILRKFQDVFKHDGFKQDISKNEASGSHLKHPAELQLILLLGQLNSVVSQAIETYRPNVVCNYLYEVAKQFSQFYHECSIGHAETDALKQDRLMLAAATGRVLKVGLALLGIPVPEKM
jgi:arginyl-tRNA synthetase